MRSTLTVMAGIWLGTMTACSGGASSPIPYTTGSPFGGGDGDEDTDAATSIDLDGGEPLPPGDGPGDMPPADHHGDCCKGNGSPGCDNPAVEVCVCASDDFCCESEWDDACATLVEALGCGHCTADDGGTEPPPPPGGDDGAAGGDCCEAHAGPGCDDPSVQACVCDVEPHCCDAQWSAGCIAVLEVYGCGQCEPPPEETTGDEPPPAGTSGGDPPPVGGTGDCCDANGSPGCDDPAVQDCVCMADAFCCDTEWDSLCVDQVDSLSCGTCGGGSGGEVSACCVQQAGAGCPEADVESCVCMVDDYCCSVLWDLTCAGEVASLGCGSCG